MSGAPVKFGIVFGALGFALSFLFSVFSGNGWLHILLVIFGCTAVSALLGVVVCTVLQTRVPEFFQIFGGIAGPTGTTAFEQRPAEAYTEEQPQARAASQEEEFPLEHETVAEAISSLPSGPVQASASRHFGEHIIVDKVKIKNEPRLMAQAIRTMLAKDD